jgi:hypothetical protein
MTRCRKPLVVQEFCHLPTTRLKFMFEVEGLISLRWHGPYILAPHCCSGMDFTLLTPPFLLWHETVGLNPSLGNAINVIF